MSLLTRWMLAIVMAIVLIMVIIGIGSFGILAMAFGSDRCSEIGGEISTFFLTGSPTLMIIGVLVGALFFGLNKPPHWWLGALASGGILGIVGYVVWFILVSQVWCVA